LPPLHREFVTVIRSARLLDRFLRYVRIGTAADPAATHYPSSSGQLKLGRVLLDYDGARIRRPRHWEINREALPSMGKLGQRRRS
jgi:hypothetical protein